MRGLLVLILGLSTMAHAKANEGDYLIKFRSGTVMMKANVFAALPKGSSVENLGFKNWTRVQIPAAKLNAFSVNALSKIPGVEYVQPNYKIHVLENPSMAALRQKMAMRDEGDDCPIPGWCDPGGPLDPGKPSDPSEPGNPGGPRQDNPAIPAPIHGGSGQDALLSSQWGMLDIGVRRAWDIIRGDSRIVVAVIDTGVDYTHEDLQENLWRNPGETGRDMQGQDKASNGVDDDANGYIDDSIGWDFVANDNKPYDLSKEGFELISGGNPGHGTHCAGNVAARGFNGKGISGVAPNVSIMSLRFLGEDGSGTTGGAVQALAYAIRNGARVTSNSWGSEGEDANDPDNQALRDIISEMQNKGVLMIAAAGNGHQGVGYDNDTDANPGVPASYDHDIIISVAALDVNNALGSFSNWGQRSVDIGAPGVKVFSTMVGNKYNDVVLDFFGQVITWDGTSMATPHVAGAAALYLSRHPEASWSEVKKALLSSATPISAMNGKSVSGGKLNLNALIQ